VLLTQVWTCSLFFTFSAICLNFQQQNTLKNQDLSHLSSEICKTNSVKSNSPSAFQQHQEFPHFSNTIFSFNFIWISLREWFNNQQYPHSSSKESPTKSVHPYSFRAFGRYQERGMKRCDLGELSVTNKTKQITFLHG